jgi:acylphosphatase
VTAVNAPSPPPVRRLVVQGKVQGVGFRWFVRERARRLGVAGWVRNESDGSVQILVGGPTSLVSRFLNELNVGPPNAVIESIREVETMSTGAGAADTTAEDSAQRQAAPTLPYPFEIRR